GYGVRKITRILIEEGIKTKNGGLWCPRTVSGILSNELYIGKLVSHKTTTTSYLDRKRNRVPEDSSIVFTRPEYAIISEDMFRKAQQLLAERKEQYRRTGMRVSSQNNFSSVLQCECCGRAFTRLYHMDREGHRRWGCSKRNMGGKAACPNATRIREDELVAEIKRYFSEVLKDRDSLIKAISAELQKAAHLGTSTSEKAQIQAELASLKRQFRKQEEKFDADLITMSELKERVRPIRKRMNDLEARLEAIENSPRDENYIKNIVQNIYAGIEELLNLSEWSNAQVKRVIEKITVNVKGEVTVYLKPLGRLGLESPVNIGVREKADINGTETQNNSDPETNALNENAGNVRYINFAQKSHNRLSQPAQPTPCGFAQFRGTRNSAKPVNWRKTAGFSPN
ncbi:MAG: hypothetical protein GXW96_05595, partial [Christensenellaceae bacterium]|nr:hypothetical protein [Christensenellaceae bacterium]